MPGEVIATLVVELVAGLLAHVGAEAAQAKGRTWLDRRDFDKLEDDAKQAFIAGLVFVASYDGALSPAELDEMDTRLRQLEIEQNGRDVALAVAAREEVAAAIGSDDAEYASRLVARIPEGRPREALLRVSVAVALHGDVERQLAAVRRLGKAMGLKDDEMEATLNAERSRLIR